MSYAEKLVEIIKSGIAEAEAVTEPVVRTVPDYRYDNVTYYDFSGSIDFSNDTTPHMNSI